MATKKPAQKKKPKSAPEIPMNPPPMPMAPASLPPVALGQPNAGTPAPAAMPSGLQMPIANLPQPMPSMPFPPGPSFANAGQLPASGMPVPPIPNSELLAMLRASGAGVPPNSLAAAEYSGRGGPLDGVVGTGGNVPGKISPPYSQGAPVAIDPAVMARMLKTKALLNAISGLRQNGLNNYSGSASAPQIAQGYGPGPYQYNMPSPGEPANPEASARDRVGRQGRRASRTGQFEQRLLNAGAPQIPPEMQRNTRPDLTPADFLAEQLKRQTAADQAVAQASQAMQEGGGNQAAFNNLKAAEKKAKGVNPTRAQAQTYQQVADQRGTLPGMNGNPTVAENLANRQAELASRKKAVEDRGLARGKARELGISRGAAAALNGTLGSGGDAYRERFNHYLALSGDPKFAAVMANAEHQAQNADPLRDSLIAAIAHAEDPETQKFLRGELAKRMPGGAAAPAEPQFPGEDPAKTKAVSKEANDMFPDNPGKASDYLAKNAGITRAEADAVTKMTHEQGKRFDRAAAKKAKREMDIQTSKQLFDPNQFGQANMIPGFKPAASNFAEWMAPFVGAMGNMLGGNTDRANELNAGIY